MLRLRLRLDNIEVGDLMRSTKAALDLPSHLPSAEVGRGASQRNIDAAVLSNLDHLGHLRLNRLRGTRMHLAAHLVGRAA